MISWTLVFILMGLSLYVGYRIGRWCAECGRASHDMGKTWERRQDYRS